ncbi:prolyl oligopeptidase family serine peptidase [Halobaculum sp. D14]|uniref:prolyl oligopeptidase family serine peptidase n=1 Tax=Halobaculum sp. D14 TaxID=3421642 RepID=UPI003EB7CD9F
MTDPEPPATPRRPVTEELHGESVTDPYRWLEESTDEVREWTDAQDDYADAVLDTDQRDALAERFDDLARVTDYGPVTPAGDRLFQSVKRPADEQPVLYVFPDDADVGDPESGRALVDPNDWDGDGTTSVDWFVPGPDGERLAYGVAEGGDEQYDVHVVDVATGETLETLAGTGRTNAGGFAWTVSDGAAAADGFYYVATGSADGGEGSDGDGGDDDTDGDDTDGGQLDKELRHHRLGVDADPDPADDPVVAADFDEQVWPTLETDGDALVVECMDGWERTDLYGYRGDPAAASLSPVLEGHDAVFSATLAGDDLLLVTDLDAPYSRVLSAPVDDVVGADAAPSVPDDFAELIPEREAVLRGVEPVGDRLLAHYHRDAASELVVFGRDGDRERDVDVPAHATVHGVHGADEARGGDAADADSSPAAYFSVQSFASPPAVRRADVATGATETLCAQDTDVDFDVAVTQEWFESADGTEVPAFVVRRGDVEPDGSNPAVLTGYGGFRVNRTPTFDRFRLPFLRAGGVYVLATLRGGTEYGEAWHDAGRRGDKQRVFDDAVAVASGLGDRGWADPDRLGVTGGSNGGLLVGALLTQRPDLFRVALCHVPLLDMLRFHRFLLGASWTSEYGSPEDPEAFAYLRDYSPYHNAPEAAYPATMFTTALGDTRVHPSHARKMTALLQERNVGPHPVVLRVEGDAGHGVGKPTSMLVRENAERWGFVCAELGVPAAHLDG